MVLGGLAIFVARVGLARDDPPPARRPLAQVDLRSEARQPLPDRLVERVLVLLGRVLVERGRVGPAQLGQRLRPRLDEVLVVPVELLGLVSPGPVVAALGLDALPDEIGLVALEQVELT